MRRRIRKFALVSDQGTAMYETVLNEAEFNDPSIREGIEATAPQDAKRPLEWHDVTANDAFYEDDLEE